MLVFGIDMYIIFNLGSLPNLTVYFFTFTSSEPSEPDRAMIGTVGSQSNPAGLDGGFITGPPEPTVLRTRPGRIREERRHAGTFADKMSLIWATETDFNWKCFSWIFNWSFTACKSFLAEEWEERAAERNREQQKLQSLISNGNRLNLLFF